MMIYLLVMLVYWRVSLFSRLFGIHSPGNSPERGGNPVFGKMFDFWSPCLANPSLVETTRRTTGCVVEMKHNVYIYLHIYIYITYIYIYSSIQIYLYIYIVGRAKVESFTKLGLGSMMHGSKKNDFPTYWMMMTNCQMIGMHWNVLECKAQ